MPRLAHQHINAMPRASKEYEEWEPEHLVLAAMALVKAQARNLPLGQTVGTMTTYRTVLFTLTLSVALLRLWRTVVGL
jgi:hypothetical protein